MTTGVILATHILGGLNSISKLPRLTVFLEGCCPSQMIDKSIWINSMEGAVVFILYWKSSNYITVLEDLDCCLLMISSAVKYHVFTLLCLLKQCSDTIHLYHQIPVGAITGFIRSGLWGKGSSPGNLKIFISYLQPNNIWFITLYSSSCSLIIFGLAQACYKLVILLPQFSKS